MAPKKSAKAPAPAPAAAVKKDKAEKVVNPLFEKNGRAGTRRTRYTLSVEAHVSIGNTTHALGAWTLYSKGAFRAFG